jgi:hypothetical protein
MGRWLLDYVYMLAPPAVVTEYCPLGSLYDVLKKVSA